MKYRHSKHAGNFADVHKHTVLLALIEALQKKPAGFLYLDTHAGRGRYELPSDGSGHEAADGIARLLDERGAPLRAAHPELAAYAAAVKAFRTGVHAGTARDPSTAARGAGARAYPGSPELALARLREVDRALLLEAQHEEYRALRLAFERRSHVQLREGNGWAALASDLPPRERRGLILIDPPYEPAELDRERLLAGLRTALQRFETGVYAIWYPIKLDAEAHALRHALAAILATHPAAKRLTILYSELRAWPTDTRVGLNGSGLAIVNPPWQIEERMRAWLPPLARLLSSDAWPRSARDSARWLVTSAA